MDQNNLKKKLDALLKTANDLSIFAQSELNGKISKMNNEEKKEFAKELKDKGYFDKINEITSKLKDFK